MEEEEPWRARLHEKIAAVERAHKEPAEKLGQIVEGARAILALGDTKPSMLTSAYYYHDRELLLAVPRVLAAQALESNRELNECLRDHAVQVLYAHAAKLDPAVSKRKKRGTDWRAYVYRNLLIGAAVKHLIAKGGFRPYRNDTTVQRNSACSI